MNNKDDMIKELNKMAKLLDDSRVPKEKKYIIAHPASPLLKGLELECMKDDELVLMKSTRIPTAPYYEWIQVPVNE